MPRRNSYPWKRIVADARDKDGNWYLAPELVAVPLRVAQSIRLLRHPDLILKDGRLESRATASWKDEDGRDLANVYVRFVRYSDD